MMSKENVVALVVKSDYSTAMEFRVMWEETGEHSRYCPTESCIEVVEDDLRAVLSRLADAFDVF